MKKILLDAGHFGLYNRSPVDKRYYESIFTWKLHLMLKEELESYGFIVGTTREKQDKDLPVYDRGLKAKGYDLFISLHSNAVGNGTVTPAEEAVDRICVYHSFDNKNNSKVLGEKLGEAVQVCMKTDGGPRLCTRVGVTGSNEYYGVLRGARNAGCPLYYIIEHSFHTNRRACEFLLEDKNVEMLAKAEAAVIADYFGVKKDIKGDVDGDGELTAFDYFLMKAFILNPESAKLNERQKSNADMNDDGSINAIDYLLLKNKILQEKKQ